MHFLVHPIKIKFRRHAIIFSGGLPDSDAHGGLEYSILDNSDVTWEYGEYISFSASLDFEQKFNNPLGLLIGLSKR